MNQPDIDTILSPRSSRRRWLLLVAAAVVVAAAAVAAFLLTRTGETDVAVEPERAEAVMGQLISQAEFTGSAIAERSATLSFEVGGVVASVAVAEGNEVQAGDALGTLDDAEAQRQVETASVQLRLAQLRLDDLLTEPDPSALASARQAIASAESQVIDAEQALASLSEPPNDADLASAKQAVASALQQISSSEEDLASLSEPPSDADLASAQQAVASALQQISSAEEDLASLSEPPSDADLASARQAVASARQQISSAEEDLASLVEEPSEAEISEARSAVVQSEVQLSDAVRLEEELDLALEEAFDDFCDRYGALIPSDEVITLTCRATLPLSDAQIDLLADSYEDHSSAYEILAAALIDANIAAVKAEADRQSTQSALTSAEDRLDGLLEPASTDDIYQAEQAVEAARANHAAAVARLEDLTAAPDEDDVYQARQAVEAARANHAAAVARLEDLTAAPDEDDVYQAEQALEAAKANHAAAVARLEDLTAAADEGDIAQAQASLQSAKAGLTSALTNYDELVEGPSENAIEQQRQDVRLAELSLEEARDALADLTVFAPFDGVVEAVSVQPGDRVTSGSAGFTLYTSNRMLIELTVTEEDLLDLEAGQTGAASFDAIDGVEYPVRVESISRVPVSEQGVVTYDVEARILTRQEVVQTAGLSPAGSLLPGGGFGGGFNPGILAQVQLPEGITPQQVIQAVARGEPLPEGVVLPEELQGQDLQAGAQRLLQLIGRGGGQGPGGQQGFAGRQASGGQSGDVAARPLPAPGMSASVTILTEIREEALLVPVSAVRQLDGAWFVNVPAPAGDGTGPGFQRVFVEAGESDGENVEILSGIEAGSTLLIDADNEGIAFTATQLQPGQLPGFGPGQGGFGPPGGGPGGGGRP